MTSPARCLIVDDDEATRVLASMILEPTGAEIVTVATATEAIALITDDAAPAFSVVLTDLNLLDDASAGAVLHAAARREPDTTLVVMTAHVDARVRARIGSEAAGLDVRLVDKVDLQQITRLIDAAHDQ